MGQKIQKILSSYRHAEGDDAGSRHTCWPVVVQGLLAFTIVGGLIAVPPATGSMMLVSLDGVGRDSLARTAIDAGARLVDAGPFHGSLIVSGQRSALLGMMMERHVLVLRVFSGGCGNSEQVGRELGL